ncbi:hypothetical protein E2I00_019992, partial [Balaenoptera physalus]
ISYQRLVRAEQGLSTRSHRSSTVTVLLLNPVEVQAEFLTVADKLSTPGHSPHSAYTTLLLHAFQATFGAHCDLPGLHCQLQAMRPGTDWSPGAREVGRLSRGSGASLPLPGFQSKTLAELEDIFTETAEAQELASGIGDAAEARQWLRTKLQAVGEKAGFLGALDEGSGLADLKASTQPSPPAPPSPVPADTAKPGKLRTIPIPVARCYTYSWNQDSFDILQEILLKEQELLQPGILGDDEEEDGEDEEDEEDLETEGPCLSDGMDSGYVEDGEESSFEWPKRPGSQERRGHRRPGQKFNRIYKLFKSTSQLDPKASTLRVVVFGSDRISGKVARAYSKLRRLESNRPLLTRFFKLQFFYVPMKRSRGTSASPAPRSQTPPLPTDPPRHPGPVESTNDISHYLGMLDPWYERNVLGLMHLPPEVLCQQSLKAESRPLEGSPAQLPILADMLLYYCRFAARPVLLQVYQTERLGIDGDREAIPLTLQIIYSKGAISGRSRWSNME